MELTDNAVRSHLTSLERGGLIQQLGTRPGFRKPHILYTLTGEVEYPFPTAYGPLLRHVLAVIGKRLPLPELRASLREVGRMAAKEHLHQGKDKTIIQRPEPPLAITSRVNANCLFIQPAGYAFPIRIYLR